MKNDIIESIGIIYVLTLFTGIFIMFFVGMVLSIFSFKYLAGFSFVLGFITIAVCFLLMPVYMVLTD